jgi:transposase-like protein
MTQIQDITNVKAMLWQFMGMEDPMLGMLEWLCEQLMEAEVSRKIGADKHVQSAKRVSSRSGYRVRRFDTRMGTSYLMVPKIRKGGYIPFFVTERKRSELALIQVIQEAYIQGVSTRKMERLATRLGIDSLSRSQVSQMTKELNGQAQAFRKRPLKQSYPVIWVDALYEKVRYDGRVVSMAIQIVCGVSEGGRREVLAIEPMLEESEESYRILFQSLRERGLKTPNLIVSDAHSGLTAAIRSCFPGSSWQRCKVHFMRNILVHVSRAEKERFAGQLKLLWQTSSLEEAIDLAGRLADKYEKRFPKAIDILEAGLEDSLTFFAFPTLDRRKISSNNVMERLNKEIRRRTKVVGIFPNPESYVRLVSIYLLEYSEDWSCSRAYMSASSLEPILIKAA